MASNSFRKFLVLQWKSLILKKRHFILTFLEIVFPTALFTAMVALRYKGGPGITPTQMDAVANMSYPYPIQFCISLADHTKNGSLVSRNLTYTNRPGSLTFEDVEDSLLLDDMMELVAETVENALWPFCQFAENLIEDIVGDKYNLTWDREGQGVLNLVKYQNEQTIIEDALTYQSNPDSFEEELVGAVIFQPDFDKNGSNFPSLDYKIRMNPRYASLSTEYLFPAFQISGPGFAPDFYQDFVKYQNLIDLAYIQLVTGETLLPSGYLDFFTLKYITAGKEMPYPPYLKNNLTLLLEGLLPFFLVLSFIIIVPPLMKRIVHEKQTGVKELMKLMGLPNWLHWTSWYLNAVLTSTLSILIMVGLICIDWVPGSGSVLEFSAAGPVFIFFLLYAMALIMSLFALSTLFDSPNIALAIGVVVHIMTYVIPSSYIDNQQYLEMTTSSKLGLALMPNVAMWWGIKILTDQEGKGTGLQWNTLDVRTVPDDPVTMSVVWGMLVADIVIFGLITWYIDGVNPGKFGVAKKWYFPFQKDYWCGSEAEEGETSYSNDGFNTGKYFETEFEDMPAGVVVKNLKKVFRSIRSGDTVAVNGVSFKAYKGQITALLGHNGAGKTTTMSCLTGMYSPSGGEAYIQGYNISTQMSQVRKSLGLCPQHNMLFPDLNVWEHFMFFGMMKGLSWKGSKKQANYYISGLDLEPKRNVVVTALSGGMKRKVNLGVALTGDSEVVMLDEPTSGMDPEARRVMWDLLQQVKKHRTILLTTHFMEEADVLGDRIAIMSRGKVICCGSPMFLKKNLGTGYSLVMSKTDSCDSSAVVEKVAETIPEATLKNEASGEIIVNLPDTGAENFPSLFQQLAATKTELGISNFGLSVTSMEDVFLRVGNLIEGEELDDEIPSAKQMSEGTQNGNLPQLFNKERLRGFSLWLSEMQGLLTKRALFSSRRWILYFVMGIIPAFLLLWIQILVNQTNNPTYDIPERPMDLSQYDNPITYGYADDGLDTHDLLNLFMNLTDVEGSTFRESKENITADIIADGGADIAEYRSKYIVAGEFIKPTLCLNESMCFEARNMVTGIYNSVPNHARPLSQNIISNVLLKFLDSSESHKISVVSHPMPVSKDWKFDILAEGYLSPYVIPYALTFANGFGILTAVFIIFPLTERITNAKQVQMMTGLNPGTFWLANILFDLLIYFAGVGLMLLVVLPFDELNIFTSYGAGGVLVLILLLFGFSNIPFSYASSYVFPSPAGGFVILILLTIVAGDIATTIVVLLKYFGNLNGNNNLNIASNTLRYIFTWFPIFPFTRSIMVLVQVQQENNLCDAVTSSTLADICQSFLSRPENLISDASQNYASCCFPPKVDESLVVCNKDITIGQLGFTINIPCHETISVFTFDDQRGINTDLIFIFVDMLLFASIIYIVESGLFSRIRTLYENYMNKDNLSLIQSEDLDEDVKNEQDRVKNHFSSANDQDDIMSVINLRKNFGNFSAVKGLSFGVHQGECFGLLGVNGAGKTTTFRMLTGDEIRTDGQAKLVGFDLTKDRKDFLRQIGYCPQFDSIIEVLTGREMLALFCRLRALKSSDIPQEVDKWLKFVGIEEYADRQCGTYSGGNKRKLNMAMALVGDPAIVFLDEPSTGVDPVARRKLWTVVSSITKRGQAVILTSHSMEECEALCDRLGIMVRGQFKCLGGTQHLKNKFGQGFTILVKLDSKKDEAHPDSTQNMQVIKTFMSSKFNGCSIKDEHTDYLHFHISDTTTEWHHMFRAMEHMKQEFPFVEDYSVSETSLEQVFLSFAKEQQDIPSQIPANGVPNLEQDDFVPGKFTRVTSLNSSD